MKLTKWFWSLILSERGEREEGAATAATGEGSDESQGDQGAGAEADQGGQETVTLEQLQQQVNEYKTKHETLSGQSRATERNLSSMRKALETSGLRMVTDADGNVQVLPAARQQGSRFTDEHKNKFFSYFPDAKSGEEFLNLLNLLQDEKLDTGFKKFRGDMSSEQQFYSSRGQSIERMNEVYPQLNPKSSDFNKAFYDKADSILTERYWDEKTNRPLVPNADLIAAHEAAIEMGISPAIVAKAKAEGFDKGKESKKIVGTPQGSQSQGGGGGFRKLPFAEFSKLTPDQKEEYQKNEIEGRKGK